MDIDGFVSPTLVTDQMVFDSVDFSKKVIDNFENCAYDFTLVSNLFNMIDDSNFLECIDALNQYNTLYDYVYKRDKSPHGLVLLSSAKQKLELLVYHNNTNTNT